MRLLDFNLQNTQFGFFKFPASNEQLWPVVIGLSKPGKNTIAFWRILCHGGAQTNFGRDSVKTHKD